MAKSNRTDADARPSDEEIAARAYELFLQRGSAPGHENDDWLQAEAELIQARRDAQAAFTQDQPAEPAGEEARKPNGRRESTTGRRSMRQ